MSTPMEVATATLQQATESLRRAEEELKEWKAANQPLNTSHSTFVFLSSEVTRCTAVLAGAQQTLLALAAQSSREQGIIVVMVGNDGNEMGTQQDMISINDFLSLKPPMIHFSESKLVTDSKTKSSGPRNYPRDPRKVVLWDDFLGMAAEYSFGIDFDHLRFKRPTFTEYYTNVGDEDVLRGRLEANVMNICNYAMQQIGIPLLFGPPVEISQPSLKGKPDFVLHQNGILSLVGETKTVFDLPTPNMDDSLVMWWGEDVLSESSECIRSNTRPSVYHIITQVYGYISNHYLKYGMLTNGQVFWFLYLEADPGKLFISPAVSLNNESPSLFQCIFCLISLVMNGHQSGESPADDKFPSPTQEYTPFASVSTAHHYNTRGQKKSHTHPDFPSNINLASLNERIGRGKCGNVFKYVDTNGLELALKCCDIHNNKVGFQMMKNEIKIYELLLPLQGRIIPKLHWYGICGETFIIATTFINGNRPEQLPVDMVRNFRSILAEHGVEHGDMSIDNVIIDGDISWLIDFGKSTTL